jgi:cytochrome c1
LKRAAAQRRPRSVLLLASMWLAGCGAALDESAQRGHGALQAHGCHSCHIIPGVVGSARHVGPPLAGFARRTLIAGRLANTPDNLVAWIVDPQSIDPASAMPAMRVSEADARDMAAYLLQLR